jgi:hypothetical protein
MLFWVINSNVPYYSVVHRTAVGTVLRTSMVLQCNVLFSSETVAYSIYDLFCVCSAPWCTSSCCCSGFWFWWLTTFWNSGQLYTVPVQCFGSALVSVRIRIQLFTSMPIWIRIQGAKPILIWILIRLWRNLRPKKFNFPKKKNFDSCSKTLSLYLFPKQKERSRTLGLGYVL